MNAEILTEVIPVEDVPSAAGVSDENFRAALQIYLRALEGAGQEVIGVGLFDPKGTPRNIVDTLVLDALVKKPKLEVFLIADEATLRAKVTTHTPVEGGYAVMLVGGAQKNVLVARPGRSLVWTGMISTFGGPGDTGMTSGEPLAIIRDGDITPGSRIAALFEGGKGPALGRRLLNKTTSYIACRWDYKTTPRSHLLVTEVEVRNPVTGKSIKAQPADWGPAQWTNRVADLSDFAAGELGLKTNDVCEVIVPLPAVVAGPPAPTAAAGTVRAALVAVARDQYQRYHGMEEANEPMLSRIKGYWDELKAEAGNEFTFTSATTVPWSAVFVCWCLKQAGVTNAQFRFSRQHSVYIHAAIARANATPQQNYPALDAQNYVPVPGDIIHWNRNGGTVTYAGAGGNNDYESHCVIVVDLGQDNQGPCAITVGGNENDSVGQTRLPLSTDGRLVPRSGNPYISIIKMG
jgi:Uncharacterized protein conserved in bacteria (DUF2272)